MSSFKRVLYGYKSCSGGGDGGKHYTIHTYTVFVLYKRFGGVNRPVSFLGGFYYSNLSNAL